MQQLHRRARRVGEGSAPREESIRREERKRKGRINNEFYHRKRPRQYHSSNGRGKRAVRGARWELSRAPFRPPKMFSRQPGGKNLGYSSQKGMWAGYIPVDCSYTAVHSSFSPRSTSRGRANVPLGQLKIERTIGQFFAAPTRGIHRTILYISSVLPRVINFTI